MWLLSLLACEPDTVDVSDYRLDMGDQDGTYEPQQCLDGEPSTGDLFSDLGIMQGAQFMYCRTPEGGEGTASFTGFTGNTVVINGGSVRLELDWDGLDSLAGHPLILGFKDRNYGYYVIDTDTAESPLIADFYFSQTAEEGDHTMVLGIDDGTGTLEEPITGPMMEIPFELLNVESGDVQVNINWDTQTDVDLHVIDPSGERVYFGNTRGESGGELDLDSNAGCSIDGVNSENIYWPTDGAPAGLYEVQAHYWSACSEGGQTDWRVTVIREGDVSAFDGFFLPEDSGGPYVSVTTFTVQ